MRLLTIAGAVLLASAAVGCSAPGYDPEFDPETGTVAEALSSQCGPTLESEDVELLSGNLSVSAAFVAQHEKPVGRLITGSVCSGTLIAPDLFLTAGHCVAGGVSGAVVEFNFQRKPGGAVGPVSTYNVVEIVEYLTANPNVAFQQDYSIIRLAGNPGNTWGVASVAETPLAAGSPIVMIGHPEGLPKQVAPGVVDSITGFVLNVVVDAAGGSSGSGLLDANGQLNGIFFRGGCETGGPFNGGLSMANLITLSPTLTSLKGPPPPPPPPPGSLPLNATFTTGTEGFTYADNAFRGANQPNFASGALSGGKLGVTVGGGTFTNASGGWSKSFTTTAAGPVNVSFKYGITSDLGIDPGEWVEALVSIDGTLYGAGATDYVRRIEDGGNQAEVTFSFTSASLSAGSHTITLGAAMNAATFVTEAGTITIDDVSITAGSSCTPSCGGKQCGSDGCGGSCGTCGSGLTCDAAQQCVSTSPITYIDEKFASTTGGFSYADNIFRGANQPNFASGALSAGKLSVKVGGGVFTNTSGGWSRSFTTTGTGTVKVSFKYSITSDLGIDPGEWVEALVSIDGTLYGAGAADYVRRIEDGGNQAEVTFSFTSASLSAGSHTIRLGAAMNAATFLTEVGTITIDDVLVTRP